MNGDHERKAIVLLPPPHTSNPHSVHLYSSMFIHSLVLHKWYIPSIMGHCHVATQAAAVPESKINGLYIPPTKENMGFAPQGVVATVVM